MSRSVPSIALLLALACLLSACPFYGQSPGMGDLLERANAEQSAGQYGDAAGLYAQATVLSPRQPELWSNRGVMEFLSNQIDASITSLKRSLALDPRLFTPMLFLGKDYVRSGKPALALPYLDHAHALKPGDVEVLLTLGKAEMDVEEPRAAASFYADASRIAPDSTEAWFGLGVSSLQVIDADGSALAAAGNQSIWARSLYADELLEQGRPLEAIDNYKAALAGASAAKKSSLTQNLMWMQAHAELLHLPASSQEALQKLNAELAARPGGAVAVPCRTAEYARGHAGAADALLDEAGCAYRAGDYDGGARDADQALRQSAQSAEARYWSVKASERIAVTALARFEELSPESAANHVLVGNLYRLQNHADGALVEYEKALAIDAHNPSALLGAVLACLSTNKTEKAAAFDRTALADRPLDPQLNLLMAETLEAEGREDEVGPYLAKCTDAPPELQPRVHYLLGRVYAREGKTDEAIEQFELALPSDRDGSMHYQLARLYKKAGNVAEEEKVMAEAKDLIAKRLANAFVEVREATAASQ
jgi:tetratricopeptide (TPR) repeat protein